MTVVSLHLTFGLLVMPELAPFSHSAYLHAKVADVGMQLNHLWSRLAEPSKANIGRLFAFCSFALHLWWLRRGELLRPCEIWNPRLKLRNHRGETNAHV